MIKFFGDLLNTCMLVSIIKCYHSHQPNVFDEIWTGSIKNFYIDIL